MDIVQYSLKKPVTVLVGVILVLLFGVIGLLKMPYQLSPSVTEPEITVTTTWVGATPYEIEREIIEEQEKVLKGIPGLIELESSGVNDLAQITLRFTVGTDVDDALLRVSNKLNEVREYPENVDRPSITATGAATSPVIWMILKAGENNSQSIYNYATYFENEIRQYLERVEGVADLFFRGGRAREMHVIIDPGKLVAHGLTAQDVTRILNSENVNISAGALGVGRRNYRIRTVSQYDSPEDIKKVVLRSTGLERVTVADVAEVRYDYAKMVAAMMHNGEEGMAVGIKPEPGANILELTDRVEGVVKWLNDNKLKQQNIYFEWVYDQRPYINGAINLVKQNILIGGILAVVVLLVFLRSVSSTLVVAAAIPISVIGTFIVMNALGRNLNVVSLAGISFAVGMLVDNAIVVLENIDRHRKLGKSVFSASYDGTREVWGAVLASTLTTIAVFLPVVFIEEEAGQLFRDIAIAVTAAVALSLVVSISVIPMLSHQLASRAKKSGVIPPGRLQAMGERLGSGIMFLVGLAIRNRMSRLATVLLWVCFAGLVTWGLFPKMEYLPQGNRNLIFSILIPPPGLSYEERHAIGQEIFRIAGPHIRKEHDGFPAIKEMFYVGFEGTMLFGAVCREDERVRELIPLFNRLIYQLPGMYGVSIQAGIFQTRLGKGRTIDVDIRGEDIGRTVQAAGAMFGLVKNAIPAAQIRPTPSLEIMYPEVRFLPERDRLRTVEMSASQLGELLDVLMDGRKIGTFKEEGKKEIDLILKAADQDFATPEDIYTGLVQTPAGGMVPVSSLAEMEKTVGINEIRHLERLRTVTLQVTPPEEIPLQEAMEIIDNDITPQLKKMGLLEGLDVSMSGTANKLIEAREAMQWNFVLAGVIIYLLMAALFANFIYPLVIMVTLPLAAAGGFVGLKLVNIFSSRLVPLDILTMLGFVILIGVVVNNAILIVHQALNNIREHGMGPEEAVVDSTRTRLRPIYMSATTSIFGMLPLVVAPGPGSELYRGLGSVVLGGLALSTLLTIFVIPALLLFFIKTEKSHESS